MFDLFQFMMLRPPAAVDRTTTISMTGQTEFTASLRAAKQGPSPQAAMVQAARAFILTPGFVSDPYPASLYHSAQYAAVNICIHQKAPKLDALKKLIEKAFKSATEKGFLIDKQRIQDSILALQLADGPPNVAVESLAQVCRVIDLIERVLREDPTLSDSGAIAQSAARVIVLPAGLFPILSAPAPPDTSASAAAAAAKASAAAAKAAQTEADLANREAALGETLQVVKLLSLQASQAAPPQAVRPLQASEAFGGVTANALPPVAVRSGRALPAFDQAAAAGLSPLVLQSLSPTVNSVLSSLQIDPLTTSLPVIEDRLTTELLHRTRLPIPIPGPPPPDPTHGPFPPEDNWDGPPPVMAGPPQSPAGYVTPAGIADLLVVREHVLRYEPGEIAYVENVAANELFKRRTRRKDTTLNSTLTITSTTSETQRDLQSTSRFDLQRQAQSLIEVDASRVPGVGSSDAYGPLVDSGGSSQQSASQASGYGQSVTSRAVSKLTQSLQTQVLQVTTSEFDEAVEHDIDNTKNATSEIVIYQWLDKISQAQIFSYDKRVLYDFTVPEPAIFLIHALRQWQPDAQQLLKPTPFALKASDLSILPSHPFYYQIFANGYGATGIQPPIEPKTTLARSYGNTVPDQSSFLRECPAKEAVPIPPGYQATSAYVNIDWFDSAANMVIDVLIGQRFFSFDTSTPGALTGNLNAETGSIPVTVLVRNASEYAVHIEITCDTTPQYMAQWQATTHDAILQASKDRLAEYEDRVNTLETALLVQAAAKTAEQKDAMVRAELEKACISILSGLQFDGLNAVTFVQESGIAGEPLPGDDVYPQLFLPNVDAVGRYIRFFERAFEWDQMLYRFYPYFWGRKKYWDQRLQLDDVDSPFAAFLNAGAARVTLIVRKGYEDLVSSYLKTGTIPANDQFPAVATDLDLGFVAEMLNADGTPDTAVAYGDPWEVRVPTTLVKIRRTDTLPKWKQQVAPAPPAPLTGVVIWVPDNPGDPLTP